MNASFLSALSLYYSHNGTSSPVNVKVLLLMVTKHFKQRTVSLEDLRLLLGLVQGNEAAFDVYYEPFRKAAAEGTRKVGEEFAL